MILVYLRLTQFLYAHIHSPTNTSSNYYFIMHILSFVSLAPGIFCFMHLPGARQAADYNAQHYHSIQSKHICVYTTVH